MARSLAFNKITNVFILSEDKSGRLRASGGSITIKDTTNTFSSPMTAFASLYPKEFEDPKIEKIPATSIIPNGGQREIRIPSFDVLLTCTNKIEMRIIVLELRKTWKETFVTRNFAVVSPMVASSIASLDQSTLALTILAEVIKTLKDLNLTTTESGKLQSPIKTLITFLLTRAVDEMEKDSDAKTSSTTLDAANDTEKVQYKNEIGFLSENYKSPKWLLQRPQKE